MNNYKTRNVKFSNFDPFLKRMKFIRNTFNATKSIFVPAKTEFAQHLSKLGYSTLIQSTQTFNWPEKRFLIKTGGKQSTLNHERPNAWSQIINKR